MYSDYIVSLYGFAPRPAIPAGSYGGSRRRNKKIALCHERSLQLFFPPFSKGGGRVAGSGMARNLGQREATVIRPCDRVLRAGADQRTTR